MSNFVKTTDNSYVTGTSGINYFNGSVVIKDTTPSTSPLTGSLITNGGLGVYGNIYCAYNIYCGGFIVPTISSISSYVNDAINNGTAITSKFSSLLAGNVDVPGILTVYQSRDNLIFNTFSTTPSFAMTSGMVYYLATNSTAITSLSFTNIPATPQSTYVFTFVLLPSTVSSAYYLKPPINVISITAIAGAINTAVPLFGLSNVSLPASYTYLLQTITIVNVSTTTTPSFISFVSVSGY